MRKVRRKAYTPPANKKYASAKMKQMNATISAVILNPTAYVTNAPYPGAITYPKPKNEL